MKGIVLYSQDFPVIREDEVVIKENITRILMTLPGERVCNPTFGCRLKLFLFDLETVVEQDMQREIKNAISRWEPRVSVNSVIIQKAEDSIYVLSLECTMIDTLEVFTYERLIRL